MVVATPPLLLLAVLGAKMSLTPVRLSSIVLPGIYMQVNKPVLLTLLPRSFELWPWQCSRSKSGQEGDPSWDGADGGWAVGKACSAGLRLMDLFPCYQAITARCRTVCFPRRLFSLLSVNMTHECLLFRAWQHYTCTHLCVCLCVYMLKKKKYSEAHNKMINEWRCYPWDSALEQEGLRQFSHAEDHTDFSPACPVLRHPQFCQWTSRFKAAPCSDLVLSAKLQPGITLKLQTFQETLLQP